MARLSEADLRKMLGVLHAAGGVDGPEPFPAPVLDALRELVPCDVVAFHERSDRPGRVLVWAGEPVGEMTREIREAHRRLRHQDPVRRVAGARTLSDFIRMREFRRSDFYNLVHRPLGIEQMLSFYLEPQKTDARFELDRSRSDFGDRDRRVLELLLPHLRQFLRAARRRVPPTVGADVLTPRERAVLAHVANGRTNGEVAHLLGISPLTVRKHLENVYEKLDVHTRTAAVAAAFGRRV
jgi:DNA-binding CsgD family transcriptional regulator